MLKNLKLSQTHFIGLLAKIARDERDALLGNVAQGDLGEAKPARGDHNPTAALGFDPLSSDTLQVLALQDAIASLSSAARSELYTLMRIGQGHLGAKNWDKSIAETEMLGDAAVTTSLTGDVDLHDHLVKALYELKIAA